MQMHQQAVKMFCADEDHPPGFPAIQSTKGSQAVTEASGDKRGNEHGSMPRWHSRESVQERHTDRPGKSGEIIAHAEMGSCWSAMNNKERRGNYDGKDHCSAPRWVPWESVKQRKEDGSVSGWGSWESVKQHKKDGSVSGWGSWESAKQRKEDGTMHRLDSRGSVQELRADRPGKAVELTAHAGMGSVWSATKRKGPRGIYDGKEDCSAPRWESVKQHKEDGSVSGWGSWESVKRSKKDGSMPTCDSRESVREYPANRPGKEDRSAPRWDPWSVKQYKRDGSVSGWGTWESVKRSKKDGSMPTCDSRESVREHQADRPGKEDGSAPRWDPWGSANQCKEDGSVSGWGRESVKRCQEECSIPRWDSWECKKDRSIHGWNSLESVQKRQGDAVTPIEKVEASITPENAPPNSVTAPSPYVKPQTVTSSGINSHSSPSSSCTRVQGRILQQISPKSQGHSKIDPALEVIQRSSESVQQCNKDGSTPGQDAAESVQKPQAIASIPIEKVEASSMPENAPPSSVTAPSPYVKCPSPISSSGITSHIPNSSCTKVQGRILQNVSPNSGGHPTSSPALEVIWRGCFEVLDFSGDNRICEEFLAHPSAKISRKAYEFSRKIAGVLQFKIHPRPEFWPEIFQIDGPDANDIALYFYPGKIERSRKQYSFLLKLIEKQDLMLRTRMGHVELLVFPSKLLHVGYQTLNGTSYFMWGVFRHSKDKKSSKKPEAFPSLPVAASTLCQR